MFVMAQTKKYNYISKILFESTNNIKKYHIIVFSYSARYFFICKLLEVFILFTIYQYYTIFIVNCYINLCLYNSVFTAYRMNVTLSFLVYSPQHVNLHLIFIGINLSRRENGNRHCDFLIDEENIDLYNGEKFLL